MASKLKPAKWFKVPLTGSYNTRIAQSNAAAGTSGIIGIGIVGLFKIGASPLSSDKDERYINCFLTAQGHNPDGSARNVIIKRPGMAVNNTPSAGNAGNAILVWTGQATGDKVISSFGTANSTIYDGTTSLGAITGKTTGITETFVSTTATLTVSSNDNTAWYYDTGVAVMTKITSANYPGNGSKTLAGTFAHLDGYMCALFTDGTLAASDLNSVTAWTSTSTDTANAYPDKGVGCVRHRNLIMVFGSESIQFWQNAGLTPFPLSKVENMTLKVGAINADSIAQISDVVFFAGSSPQGGCSIYQFDGQLQRISFPEQEYQLLLSGPSNLSMTTKREYGRSFVMVVSTTTTYCYCLEDKRWHELSSATPLWYKSAGLSVGTQILTYYVSKLSTSGKVYIVNPSNLVFTDDGATYTATIQSPEDDSGSPFRKMYEELRVVADIEPTTSTLSVAYSDDDYVSFTTHGTIDLSAQTNLTRLRSSRPANGNKRAWKLTHASNTAMRIKEVLYRASVGLS